MDLKRCLIIAEAGVNHNGDVNIAFQLCDAAKEAGADVVKFQTWKTEDIITKTVAQATYQTENTGINESQFDMLKRLELPYADFYKIKRHCDCIGIKFASTADDKESLDFLVDLGMPFIKISSGDIGNVDFLRYIGSKGLPIILSTGMSSLDDVKLSVDCLRQGGALDISILHCTTNYPCPFVEVNLMAMDTLRDVFGLPVGYSDHTKGFAVPVGAVARGACILEKHFTLDNKMDGPDHLASMNVEEFSQMVSMIRGLEVALGDGKKGATRSEREIAKVITKRLVARTNIQKGDVFSEKNVTYKRNDKGALARQWDCIIGKTANKGYLVDEGIEI